MEALISRSQSTTGVETFIAVLFGLILIATPTFLIAYWLGRRTESVITMADFKALVIRVNTLDKDNEQLKRDNEALRRDLTEAKVRQNEYEVVIRELREQLFQMRTTITQPWITYTRDEETRFAQFLAAHFDEAELKSLVLEMGVSYDAIPHDGGLPNTAVNVVQYFKRRAGGEPDKLRALVKTKREGNW